MRSLDLNVDLGEGGPNDAELIALASSANIACGGHAGDETAMRAAVQACMATGVAIGAHPGYEDREHFGRRPLHLSSPEVTEMVSRQITRLAEIAAAVGGKIHHVKPHGALYNQADQDAELAAAVVEGVSSVLPGCRFYAPPSGELAHAGNAADLNVIAEGFVDRRYQESGSLVPRSEAGAEIEDIPAAVEQALEIATNGRVRTILNTWIPLPAMTLCVHGDGEKAIEVLSAVRHALEAAGFTIRA